jgi:uncharacterized protein YbbC (DUF1343 family)
MFRAWSRAAVVAAVTVAIAAAAVRTAALTTAQGDRSGFDTARLARLDAPIQEAIAERKLPGAVLVVGRDDTVVLRKAYGRRAVAPVAEAMTPDTIFDVSSLTKVIATTPAVMQLIEDGRIRLIDPVASFLPEFGRYGKAAITIRDLLTHYSGLRAGLDLAEDWSGSDTAIRLAIEEVPVAPPGTRFIYSDINFVLLAEIVARASGRPFEQYVAERLFRPLGMDDTTFRPAASLAGRIAPASADTPRGVVHDPTARRMGGVAGHAGLFSTADDLTRFARMLLGGGLLDGARVLSPLSVARMTAPSSPASQSTIRGLGWDLDSTYSSNRGELLPLGSFGHTGFTGTSIWVDPATRIFILFLSNRLHPDGLGDVTPLRARVATIVASSLTQVPASLAATAEWSRQPRPVPAVAAPPAAPVVPGVDVLRADSFAALKGRRVGLLTNHTGIGRDRTPTIDRLAEVPGVTLAALFSPEHGIRGILDASVPSSRDPRTGLTIHSLYGTTRRPTAEMLSGLDAIVIDLQDIGARFYTYMTSMAYVMEEAAKARLEVFVLDRPNPIGGVQIEGPALDPSAVGFTGYFEEMPIRHGMTMGELARLFKGERRIDVALTVVSMRHWQRDAWFDETGLPWINPSPNMRTLYAAALYPGLGAFEQTNVSVGRGTDTPFEQIGAPWIDGARLADALNARAIPGVRFYPVTFTPTTSTFAKQECHGVFIVITDRAALRPVRVGVEIAGALVKLFPNQFKIEDAARLFGSMDGLRRLEAGEDPAAVAASWGAAEARWRRLRAKYLLY